MMNKIVSPFKINKYITLQFEKNTTKIYIAGINYGQCKYLLLNIPVNDLESSENINSIDEAQEVLDSSLEPGGKPEINIEPKVEYWGIYHQVEIRV